MRVGICGRCGEHCRLTCDHEAEADSDAPCPLGDECESERMSECCGFPGTAYDHDPN